LCEGKEFEPTSEERRRIFNKSKGSEAISSEALSPKSWAWSRVELLEEDAPDNDGVQALIIT